MIRAERLREFINLAEDYTELDKQEKEEFYQSKCEYYQLFIWASLIGASFVSVFFLISDYQLNQNHIWPTILTRTSILIGVFIYLQKEKKYSDFRAKVLWNYLLAHMIIWATIGSIYFLQDKTHASDGFTIMNLIFLTIGYGSPTKACLISYFVFLGEIMLSNLFNHYTNLATIMALQIPCAMAILFSQWFHTLLYFDHFNIKKRLEKTLVTDPLTQVFNRHKLEEIVVDNKMKIHENAISISIMDIDFFKKVNDTYGHNIGDETLAYLGKKLTEYSSKREIVIRYGGEEFLVIHPGDDLSAAYEKEESFRKIIEDAKDAPIPFCISIGVAAYQGDFAKTIIQADRGLYQAKQSGRNKVVKIE